MHFGMSRFPNVFLFFLLLLPYIAGMYKFLFSCRYGPVGPPIKITCKHNKKGATYQCTAVTKTDQLIFHKKFYNNDCKTTQLKLKQDCFILKYTESNIPKKSRLINNTKGEKSFSTKYFIYSKARKQNIQVCQKAFANTLRLSKNRICAVVARNFHSGLMPIDKRGGDRKSKTYEAKKLSVINFIKRFQVIENHYCRSKTSNRIYLHSDLNINKMWRMYNGSTLEELQVKPSYFRHIFKTVFNIGFGSPQTDACSTCISLNEKINNEKDICKNNDLQIKKRVHKLKASAFYSLLKEKQEDLLILTFDCQKNQQLPKVPDQSAYYSRQISKYNLTVVVGDSRSKQTTDNVFIYHWNENEYNKGPNEIISAVYHCLTSLHIPEEVKVIRLASDGCGAQNKNYYMMGMICSWLLNNAPNHIKSIEYIFPMVGHSFLPPDRVFARIEKDIRKKDVIVDPDEYKNIFSQFGTVIPLAGNNFNWKESIGKVVRPPGQWHMHFNPCKRFTFKVNKTKDDVLVKGDVNYRSNIQCSKFKSICKRSKKIKDIVPPALIPVGVQIAALKINDVSLLLSKHFGNDWMSLQTLSFYKDIVQQQQNNEVLKQEDSVQEICENYCEIDGLII